MSVLEDFQKFAFKGNVIDLAVGTIIGAAFGKIVSGVVDHLLMPLVGCVMPNPDWRSAAINLKEVETLNDKGEKVRSMAKITYGQFFGVVLDFLIIAVVLFIVVSAIQKAMERAKKKQDEAIAQAPLPAQEVLLTEIRDLLKAQAVR